MRIVRPLLAFALFALFAPGAIQAAGPVSTGDEKMVSKIAKFVDAQLAKSWADNNITPSPAAEDAEFARRVYLDLIGRIPKVAEVREFEADKSKTKRLDLIEKLMKKPGFASHMAATTRNAWLPETLADQQTMYLGQQYEEWLRREFGKNTPLDEIVKRTLTVPVYVGQRGNIRPGRQVAPLYDQDQQYLQSFYQAMQAKPENLGAAVSRAFLGVKLECAQCHDHPFASYSREQFWQFAAFFGEFTPLSPYGPNFVGPIFPQSDKYILSIPNSGKQVTARFMDGKSPDWSEKRIPREELAEWLTDDKNPYFARNLANRIWFQLFGVGIIDPVDEPGENNLPSHPELLNGLAKLVVESRYDLQTLLKGIIASKTYQLTSTQTHPSQSEPRRFARKNMKGLTPNQIYDSFAAATGLRNPQQRGQFYNPNQAYGRGVFAMLFPSPAKPTQTESSILQALMMMNGKLVADQTSLDKSEVLAAVIDAPFLDTNKKLEALFFAVLTRKPTLEENEKLSSYIDRGGPSGDQKKALSDIFWVLLNSPEFLFNH